MSTDLYALRPDLYDLMHADHGDDMRFLGEFVLGLPPESLTLELGCGTGRLLAPMADAGARVVGLDREPAMAAVARLRLAGYGERIRVFEGDMRSFSLEERFDLVVIGLNTFMHLLTAREQSQCLERIHRHLHPAGTLLLDLANPHAVVRDTPLGVLQHRFTRPALTDETVTVTLWSATTLALAEQLTHTMLFFDEVTASDGGVRRTIGEVMLRLTYRFELELLLARAGFAIRHLYGDYESGLYDEESERMICEATALA